MHKVPPANSGLRGIEMRIALLLVSVSVLCACNSSDFSEKFNSVQIGASLSGIIRILGQADARQEQTFPEGPFFGPGEELSAVLNPGELYQEWIYTRDGWDYYIWFKKESASSQNEWRVVQTAKYLHGAVFESSGS